MARWGKNVVVPLDSLIKEKENTNRPTATRSAGTVGKWGKMGFTSTRTLKSIAASSSPANSPEDGSGGGGINDCPLPAVCDVPKPKKFFKSRNTSIGQNIYHLPRAPPSPIRSEGHSPPKREPALKLKIPKAPPMERKKSTSSDKCSKMKKKKEEKKLKPEAPPSRIISRNRKIVNYNEDDDDRSQTPLKDIIEKFAAVATRRESPLAAQQPEVVPSEPPIAMEPPVIKTVPVEHPPIVLRISKGTSRLISTDSEDILSSPIREPPSNEQPIAAPATELRAVEAEESEKPQDLSIVTTLPSPKQADDLIVKPIIPVVTEENPKKEEPPVKLESLKIVIKASALEKPEKKGKSKKHHRTASGHKVTEHTFKTPSPQPGNDNYDLYRTLAASPSDRDFDSQSSILGSISSKETSQFPAVIPDESCVIRSRGSSDITSDVETSQHSSLVAVPSDIESRLESMMDCDDDEPTADRALHSVSAVDRLTAIQEEPLTEDILDVLTGGVNDEVEDFKEAESLREEVKEIDEPIVTPRRTTRGRKGAKKEDVSPPETPEESPKASCGRVTRNNNNGSLKNKKAPPVRSYSRKCKNTQVPPQDTSTEKIMTPANSAAMESEIENIAPISRPESVNIDLPDAPPINDSYPISDQLIDDTDNQKPIVKEYKIKNKIKRAWCDREASKSSEMDDAIDEPPSNKIKSTLNTNDNILSSRNAFRSSKIVNNNTESGDNDTPTDDEKRSVKLVISKKKGSIFKSRALVAEPGKSTKRHVYKHTWDADKEKSLNAEGPSARPSDTIEPSIFDEDFNEEEPTAASKLTRFTRQNIHNKFENENVTSVKCDKKVKEYYTVVRNVKTAHQIQEIGEYQEMDDDVEYILDALQPQNPIPTRCLSALQLASKCMTPAFRMHVRAHGTATKFFKALKDAKKDLSLGLCTAAIMFVLSQDRLNMDLDRESLELMMNLLESDVGNTLDEYGITNYERNKQKVKELCEEIKNQGKAAHLNIDSITVGTLAMETLLSLTSKRAGEWFKEELRELGGLEHIIKTICECCHQISDYVVSWTDVLLDKLKTIERCLRVLENVSEQNERNQEYILRYSNGHAVNTLFKLYKLCDSEIALYPTTDATPKENPGVVLREALVPTLKVLINLTHPFNDAAIGSAILGERAGVFDTSFHILLQAPNYIPERCIFELSILVLYLLINLTMHTVPNRTLIMKSHAPSDFGNQFDKVPAIKALIEYFYKCEEQARLAEQNTDAILENPADAKKSQEEVDETVTKLLQKAGHHMEHTMKASYAGLLIGHLISGSDENEKVIRSYLNDNSFKDIISILEKYYNFMNLTASSEATSHIKSTKKLIDYFKKCDTHSSESVDAITIQSSSTSSSVMTTRSTPRVYKTYSQR